MKFKKPLLVIIVIVAAFFAASKILHSKKEPTSEAQHGKEAEHGHADEHGHGKEHEDGGKGRIELSAEQLKLSGIVIEEPTSMKLKTKLRLFGKVNANEERLAHVAPRYPGIVKKVTKRLGDKVEKDELLAVVQSNESLQNYEIKAEIAGTVVERHVVVGEYVGTEDRLYAIADLQSVWVDLNVYRQDFPKLKIGERLLIEAPGSANKIDGAISYISPFGAESSQTMLARAEVPNPEGILRPGLFVSADAILGETEVSVAVKESAIQTVENAEALFVQEGDSFEARPVRLGRRDGEWVEVLSGIKSGEKYASQNSFILKAEIGKGEAEHEH